MNQLTRDFLLLTASGINRTPLEKERAAAMDLRALFKLSMHHSLTTVAASALEAAGVQDAPFQQEKRREELRLALMEHERLTVEKGLAAAKIWYMPLKGALLKDCYPSAGMRQMSDVDILFDAAREDEIQAIMEKAGFTLLAMEASHHANYWKPPVTHVEMHRMLFSDLSDERVFRYYEHVSERLLGEGEEKHFSREDFYLYMIAHEFKHFCWFGTGLRSLTDTYVYIRRYEKELDWDYIAAEARKIGIERYEKANRELAMQVFRTGQTDGLTRKQRALLEYYLTDRPYEVSKSQTREEIRKIGVGRYIWHRLFPPMIIVEYLYPFFYYHKALLPFMPIWRITQRVVKVLGLETEEQKENAFRKAEKWRLAREAVAGRKKREKKD